MESLLSTPFSKMDSLKLALFVCTVFTVIVGFVILIFQNRSKQYSHKSSRRLYTNSLILCEILYAIGVLITSFDSSRLTLFGNLHPISYWIVCTLIQLAHHGGRMGICFFSCALVADVYFSLKYPLSYSKKQYRGIAMIGAICCMGIVWFYSQLLKKESLKFNPAEVLEGLEHDVSSVDTTASHLLVPTHLSFNLLDVGNIIQFNIVETIFTSSWSIFSILMYSSSFNYLRNGFSTTGPTRYQYFLRISFFSIWYSIIFFVSLPYHILRSFRLHENTHLGSFWINIVSIFTLIGDTSIAIRGIGMCMYFLMDPPLLSSLKSSLKKFRTTFKKLIFIDPNEDLHLKENIELNNYCPIQTNSNNTTSTINSLQNGFASSISSTSSMTSAATLASSLTITTNHTSSSISSVSSTTSSSPSTPTSPNIPQSNQPIQSNQYGQSNLSNISNQLNQSSQPYVPKVDMDITTIIVPELNISNSEKRRRKKKYLDITDAVRKDMLYCINVGVSNSLRSETKSAINSKTDFDSEFRCKSVKENGFDFRFTEYCPNAFSKLRSFMQISNKDFKHSFKPEYVLNDLVKHNFSEAKGGSFFCFTADRKYIIKTVTKGEKANLIKILKPIYKHVLKNPNTLINYPIGCYKLHGDNMPFKVQFIIIRNVFDMPNEIELDARFDLKGSFIDRKSKSHESVKKDNDLKKVFQLNDSDYYDLKRQLGKDAEFFQKLNIMDYSLLLGVHKRRKNMRNKKDSEKIDEPFHRRCKNGILTSDSKYIIYIGIIDILQEYNWSKKMERFLKSTFKRRDKHGISSIPSEEYAFRFKKNLLKHFTRASSTV